MTQPNNKECVLPYCYNDDRASEKVYWKNQWEKHTIHNYFLCRNGGIGGETISQRFLRKTRTFSKLSPSFSRNSQRVLEKSPRNLLIRQRFAS